MAALLVVSVVFLLSLTTGSYVQGQCVCSNGPAAWTQLCGNDGKNYNTVCDLFTAQKTNPSLGARCLGQCPCRVLNSPFTGNPIACARPFQNPYLNGRGSGESFAGQVNGGHGGFHSGHHGGHGGRRNEGTFHRRQGSRVERAAAKPEKTDRHFIGGGLGFGYGGGFAYAMFVEPRVCLTNGTDVSGLQTARCAIATDKTSTLGIRCLGSCRFCNANPVCPVAQFPSVTVSPPAASTDITLPGVIGAVTTTVPTVAPPTAVTAPPPLPDFLAAIKKIFE